jgi:ABC-type taurine transport system substrate-binding protein
MNKLIGAAAAAMLAAGAAQAAEKVTLQLKWVTQAQFAGYYVAKDKGFYEAEGLEVEIKPGGPDIAPPQVIAGGGADVVIDWMPSALASREKGVPLVNIAQPFKSSGMMLTCRKETGIRTPEDFRGKTIAIIGLLDDKDVAAVVAPLLPHVDHWIAVTATSHRALAAAELARQIANLDDTPCLIAASLQQAMAQAQGWAAPADRILVSGSFYVVGPVLEALGLYSRR